MDGFSGNCAGQGWGELSLSHYITLVVEMEALQAT